MTASPDRGAGQEITVRVHSPVGQGAAAPVMVGLLINGDALGASACYVFRELGTFRTLLANDSGEGSRALGKAPNVANSQCELLADQTTSETTGSQSMAQFHIRFKPGFRGPKKMYAIAYDAQGGSTGLKPVGEWVVQ